MSTVDSTSPTASQGDQAGDTHGSALPATKAPRISVVVPLCNESPNVFPLVDRIAAAFQNERDGIEIVLVDDSSTDDTWKQILAKRSSEPRIRPVRHLRRGGQSAALWTGFGRARGEIIATLDGDLQNDPADLPAMIAELSKADIVCGVRTKRQDNALRRFSSNVARGARKFVLGVDFRDTGCNLRVFKRSVLATLFPFNGMHRFMPIIAQAGGAVVREMPVGHQPRTAGTSKYGMWNRLGRGILDLAAVAWYQRRCITNVPSEEYANASDTNPPIVSKPKS